MTIGINTNLASLYVQRQAYIAEQNSNQSLQRVSTGLRINSAKDDSAGMAIASRMSSQVNGLSQAVVAANDAISMTQTAESHLGTIEGLLQRMRQLAVQSANSSNSTFDRKQLQGEVVELTGSIDQEVRNSEFNGHKLIDGSLTNMTYQIGADIGQTISINIASARAADLGNYTVDSQSGSGISSAVAQASSLNYSTGNGFQQQAIIISGYGVNATTGTLAAGTSAKQVAAAVNALSSQVGVEAEARTEVTISNVSQGQVRLQLFGSNSVAVTIAATINYTNDLSALANAINARSGTTNVTAVADLQGNLKLSNQFGEDIKIGNLNDVGEGLTGATIRGYDAGTSVNLAATGGGGDAVVVGGKVNFNSHAGFAMSTSNGTSLLTASQVGSTLNALSQMDISTVAGANKAIATLDAAITSVNNGMASMGALQNRFNSTIYNLQTTSTQVQDARGRIQDTDYAHESTELTRKQILQQAANAILVQANQVADNVLTLLQPY
ncbi:flagellin [Massilia sp. TS11]|uniref:flagellin N-terminal helical domain-containing protein n=1 Tax=Massilia sp. TS11 TaxID=2908003 RepID=UPI001EDB3717|nr:flagellin [Massilia sp. TS11]